MRATISFAEGEVCELLTLDLRFRRMLCERRESTMAEDREDALDDTEEESEDGEPFPLAHLVMACSTTAARAPSRPPARKDPEEEDEDEEEEWMLREGGRAEGFSPR